jgi:hypothetical protein
VVQFLGAQRIHNLVTYLPELYAYTKLKDVARLDNFIKTESRRSGTAESNSDLLFDLDSAIRVCRQAMYFDHASYLTPYRAISWCFAAATAIPRSGYTLGEAGDV